MKDQPAISIIIPTFNEEAELDNCLSSIFRQQYPQEKLEVLVVDDDSTDKTIEIAKKYPVKILHNGFRHGEIGKMIGFKQATGEYAMYLDADNELVGKNWFEKMLRPLREDSSIIGSFTYEGAKQGDSAIDRYLSFDPLQRDSIYQWFSPSISDTVIEKRNGYYLCVYLKGRIPPAGRCLYRRKEVMRFFKSYEMFLELDFLVLLLNNGWNKFAYVSEAGLYHHHARNLHELIHKRVYNLKKVYFAHVSNKLYTWFNLTRPRDILKLFSWIIYANLIIPSITVGIYKTLKFRDLAGMYEPVVNFLITDALILSALLDKRTFSLFK